jgi:hypothetical protein
LNKIFASGVVDIQVLFAGEENINYDVAPTRDGKLTMFKSNGELHEGEFKKVYEQSKLKSQNPNHDAYVFIFGPVEIETPTPLSQDPNIYGKNFSGNIMMNWGILDPQKNHALFYNIAAHECGHALFKFKHPFQEFSVPTGESCVNIMDYCEDIPRFSTDNNNGIRLRRIFKYQWEQIKRD